MSRVYDRPIVIQKINEDTEQWDDVYKVHARINKSKNDNEYLSAGAIVAKENLVFEVRYFAEIEDIRGHLQHYRIVYRDVTYNIEDFDDYMLQHKTVKLLGASYGE